MKRLLTAATHWGVGIICSTLIIWTVAFFFTDSTSPLVIDKTTNDYIPMPGTVAKHRSEGWGESYYGQHGFIADEVSIALADTPKVILWGDSHIQALQVSDDSKISAVFNTMSQGTPYSCISYGRSGQGVSDYYFTIPKYSKILPNIKGHVILLSGMNDVMPFRETGNNGRFRSAPWRLEEGSFQLNWKGLTLGPIIHSFGLAPFYDLYNKAKTHEFRFLPGEINITTAKHTPRDVPEDITEGWNFLLRSLKEQSDGFFIFIYTPSNVPSLKEGNIQFENHEHDLIEQFHKTCEKNNVEFIDMTGKFTELYLKNNVLPRGFFNSPPGTGHLNKHGLRAIAESLHDYFAKVEK